MAKCYVLSCRNEAVDGKEGMPCPAHFLESVHLLATSCFAMAVLGSETYDQGLVALVNALREYADRLEKQMGGLAGDAGE